MAYEAFLASTPKTRLKHHFVILMFKVMPNTPVVGFQVHRAPNNPKWELWPSKVWNFGPKNARNSETAGRIKKILAPLEAQRKITSDRVPLLKIGDDEFFPLQWLMKRFWYLRQKRSGAKFDINYSLCPIRSELICKFSFISVPPLAQFAWWWVKRLNSQTPSRTLPQLPKPEAPSGPPA